jgi:hypothetical protein
MMVCRAQDLLRRHQRDGPDDQRSMRDAPHAREPRAPAGEPSDQRAGPRRGSPWQNLLQLLDAARLGLHAEDSRRLRRVFTRQLHDAALSSAGTPHPIDENQRSTWPTPSSAMRGRVMDLAQLVIGRLDVPPLTPDLGGTKSAASSKRPS